MTEQITYMEFGKVECIYCGIEINYLISGLPVCQKHYKEFRNELLIARDKALERLDLNQGGLEDEI